MFYGRCFCSFSTAHASCQDKGIATDTLYKVLLLLSVHVSLPAHMASLKVFITLGRPWKGWAGGDGRTQVCLIFIEFNCKPPLPPLAAIS